MMRTRQRHVATPNKKCVCVRAVGEGEGASQVWLSDFVTEKERRRSRAYLQDKRRWRERERERGARVWSAYMGMR